MTLEEFVKYLHKRTGYEFNIRANNEYSVYGFLSGTLKGYITEKEGKFYMLTSTIVSNAILNHSSVRYQRILCYKNPWSTIYHAIYEISIR